MHILSLSGPESADKKVLAFSAFVKALIEVTTEVDDDDDPQDAIKDYGKELTRSLTSFGIADATKIAKLAKKAWREKKSKSKALPSFKPFPKRYGDYRPVAAPPVPAPVAVPLPAQVAPSYAPRTACTVCFRTGHSEPTCYLAHPELRPAIRP